MHGRSHECGIGHTRTQCHDGRGRRLQRGVLSLLIKDGVGGGRDGCEYKEPCGKVLGQTPANQIEVEGTREVPRLLLVGGHVGGSMEERSRVLGDHQRGPDDTVRSLRHP